MSRSNSCIVVFSALAIMTACMSPDPSTAEGDELSPVSKAQNVQGTTPEPSPGGPSGELVPLARVPIEARAASAALGTSKAKAEIRDLALQIAASRGVAKPAKIHVVAAADHQVAETLLSGAIINDNAPVYVIKMTGGRFTAPGAPSGVEAPQGNVLTVTIDAATHRVTDIGLTEQEPDLSQLGSIVDLSAL
jgi:hypothetical protein